MRTNSRRTIGTISAAWMLFLAGCAGAAGDELVISDLGEPPETKDAEALTTQALTTQALTTEAPALDTSLPNTSTSNTSTPDSRVSDFTCGEEVPVFSADRYRQDTLDVHGVSGPGPGGKLQLEGQLITHRVSHSIVGEFRWPADDAMSILDDEEISWSLTVAGFPAVRDLSNELELKVHLLLDDAGTECSVMTALAYGPDAELLFAEASTGMSSLRPRTEVESYLEEEQAWLDGDSFGLDRPEGQCALPVIGVEVDGSPDIEASIELVTRFLADRASGARAQQCLTNAGIRWIEGHVWLPNSLALYVFSEPTCLFACEIGPDMVTDPMPVVEAPDGNAGLLVSAFVSRVDAHGVSSVVRETYRTVLVEDEDGTMVLKIDRVFTGHEHGHEHGLEHDMELDEEG